MNDYKELIGRYLAGELNEEEKATLVEQCRENPEVAGELADQAVVDRLLHASQKEQGQFLDRLMERISIEDDLLKDDFLPQVMHEVEKEKKKPGRILQFALAMAASLALCFLVIQKVYYSVTVAELTDSVAVEWTFKSYQEGDELQRGRMALKKGFAEIRFNSGAEVIVEGPAEFEIVNSNRMKLIKGNLVANVPEQAIGFKVDTPSSEIIDLGTEFAVSAAEDSTEVHVLQGLVKATSREKEEYKEFKKDEAVRITSSTKTDIKAQPERFLREMPPKDERDINYVHWSFDEGQGDYSANTGRGIDAGNARLAALKGKKKPEWVNGQFGSGIAFDGKGAYLDTDYKGIGGNKSRSVSFWVKVPKDLSLWNGFGIVSWGSYAYLGATWQISVNPTEKDGPIGRLRVGTNVGEVIGSRDLRDNRWHHVTVVMYGGEKAEITTHVLVYVDGELEKTAGKSVRLIRTDIEGKGAVNVRMGRNAAYRGGNYGYKVFRGWIDEMFIFDSALTREQVLNLKKYNQLEKK